jgi:hypothetical protein
MPVPLPRPLELIARQAQPKLAPPGRTAARGLPAKPKHKP